MYLSKKQTNGRTNGALGQVIDAEKRVRLACAVVGGKPAEPRPDDPLETTARRKIAIWLAASTLDGVRPSSRAVAELMGVKQATVRMTLGDFRSFPYGGPGGTARDVRAVSECYLALLAGKDAEIPSTEQVVGAYMRLRGRKSWGPPVKA